MTERLADIASYNLYRLYHGDEESLSTGDFRDVDDETLHDPREMISTLVELDLIETEKEDGVYFLTPYAYDLLDGPGVWDLLDPTPEEPKDLVDVSDFVEFGNDTDVLDQTASAKPTTWTRSMRWLLFGSLAFTGTIALYMPSFFSSPVEKAKPDREQIESLIEELKEKQESPKPEVFLEERGE